MAAFSDAGVAADMSPASASMRADFLAHYYALVAGETAGAPVPEAQPDAFRRTGDSSSGVGATSHDASVAEMDSLDEAQLLHAIDLESDALLSQGGTIAVGASDGTVSAAHRCAAPYITDAVLFGERHLLDAQTQGGVADGAALTAVGQPVTSLRYGVSGAAAGVRSAGSALISMWRRV